MTMVPAVEVAVMYRDADNYKEGTTLRFAGELTDELKARLKATLEDGEHYIPTQVGHEHLGHRMASWPDQQSDHVFHELDVEEIEQVTALEDRIYDGSFEDFVKTMEAAKAAGWDVSAAMAELGLEE